MYKASTATRNINMFTNGLIRMRYKMDKTNCKYHGKQNAIGNHDECETCLIVYKIEQMIKQDWNEV